MSDLLDDGNTKVSWCPAIATLSAPTTTELNVGTSLESYITPSGLQIKASTASVDTSNVASTFTTQGVGRRSYDISVEMKRQTPVDIPYNLLPYKTSGYLVVRRTTTASTSWASGQVVEVYPVTCGEPEMAPPAPNEVAKFTSPMMVTSDPSPRAVIA